MWPGSRGEELSIDVMGHADLATSGLSSPMEDLILKIMEDAKAGGGLPFNLGARAGRPVVRGAPVLSSRRGLVQLPGPAPVQGAVPPLLGTAVSGLPPPLGLAVRGRGDHAAHLRPVAGSPPHEGTQRVKHFLLGFLVVSPFLLGAVPASTVEETK